MDSLSQKDQLDIIRRIKLNCSSPENSLQFFIKKSSHGIPQYTEEEIDRRIGATLNLVQKAMNKSSSCVNTI